MATIIRSSSGPQVVRPDGVYKTGVLTSIFGYQPDNDAQAVLHTFANGPSHLGGLGAPGVFQRLGQRIKALFAQKGARKFMAPAQVAKAQAMAQTASPNQPAINEGNQIAPQIAAQVRHLKALGPQSGGGPQIASVSIAQRRWNTYYRAG